MMKTLTCPIPNNINPLQSNGFLFTINKIPSLSYFCQEVSVPGISLPTADVNSPLSRVPYAGDKVSFDDLTVEFLINEDMSNYKAIHDWIVSLGFPELHQQYADFINENTTTLSRSPVMASTSDGVLSILNSSNNVVRTVQFIDLVPTNLATVTLRSSTDDTTYLAGVATFAYNYYSFE